MLNDVSVTSSLRHHDVELIDRLSDVIDTWNLSSSSNERISLNELIDPVAFNYTDYNELHTTEVCIRADGPISQHYMNMLYNVSQKKHPRHF